jgi:hypothetical protein
MQDLPIYRSVDLPDGSGRIVLYDWSANPKYRFENIVGCREGVSIWKAKLPKGTGSDCFVDFSLDGFTVRANTWSGYLLTFDAKTGETLTSVFVK